MNYLFIYIEVIKFLIFSQFTSDTNESLNKVAFFNISKAASFSLLLSNNNKVP